MADQDADKSAGTAKSTYLLMGFAVINMLVVVGAGLLIRAAKNKETAEILAAMAAAPKPIEKPAEIQKPFVAKVIPLETFIVNLIGNSGRRIAKVSVELELEGESAPEEFQIKKVQIRDKMIVTLSNRTYEEMVSKEGKDALRELIKENLNEILKQAKVKTVYFTDIIYN